MSLNVFKEQLVQARKEKGMTQAELAGRLGVTAQAVSKWERGGAYPDIALLDGIATVLDCSLDYLFGYEKDAKMHIKQDNPAYRAEIEAALFKDAIELRFGYGLVDLFLEEQKNGFPQIHGLRRKMAETYGFCVPLIRIADDGRCEPEEYKIFLYGKEVMTGTVTELAVEGQTSEKAALQVILLRLEECIMEHLPALFHCQMVAELVETVGKRYPKVVQGVVPERVSYSFLKRVLLVLLCEKKCAIHPLIRIIELLDEMIDEQPTIEEAAERVVKVLGEG